MHVKVIDMLHQGLWTAMLLHIAYNVQLALIRYAGRKWKQRLASDLARIQRDKALTAN